VEAIHPSSSRENDAERFDLRGVRVGSHRAMEYSRIRSDGERTRKLRVSAIGVLAKCESRRNMRDGLQSSVDA